MTVMPPDCVVAAVGGPPAAPPPLPVELTEQARVEIARR